MFTPHNTLVVCGRMPSGHWKTLGFCYDQSKSIGLIVENYHSSQVLSLVTFAPGSDSASPGQCFPKTAVRIERLTQLTLGNRARLGPPLAARACSAGLSASASTTRRGIIRPFQEPRSAVGRRRRRQGFESHSFPAAHETAADNGHFTISLT
jgi:hypothetical protein